jgi:hypothetical protein
LWKIAKTARNLKKDSLIFCFLTINPCGSGRGRAVVGKKVGSFWESEEKCKFDGTFLVIAVE